MLDVYAFNARSKIREQCVEYAEKLFIQYPYEQYCEQYFSRLCRMNKVYKYKYAYQECYDACQLAYIYSIYRCSISEHNNIDGYVCAYIKKLMKIYFIAALTICDDAKNICFENGFMRINGDDYRI